MSVGGDIILSVRDQIPDPVVDPATDGAMFTAATLLRWLNDAMRIMAATAPVITDWGAIQSQTGQDVYTLPTTTMTVEQAWYDLLPLSRTAEIDDYFVTKIQGRSWWFGPHSMHATPRLHVWPAADRTGAVTTLNGAINSSVTSVTLTSVTNFMPMGFMQIESELLLYRNINTTTKVVSNLIRGQGGTVAASHNNGVTVTEYNIGYKCSRLPTPLAAVTDTVEIPQALWPVLELYILAKVRETEQESQYAAQLRKEFDAAVEKLGQKAHLQGRKQGLQVRTLPPGPELYGGRIFVP